MGHSRLSEWYMLDWIAGFNGTLILIQCWKLMRPIESGIVTARVFVSLTLPLTLCYVVSGWAPCYVRKYWVLSQEIVYVFVFLRRSSLLVPHWKLGYEGFVNKPTWSLPDSIQNIHNLTNDWIYYLSCLPSDRGENGAAWTPANFALCNQFVYANVIYTEWNVAPFTVTGSQAHTLDIVIMDVVAVGQQRPEKINKGQHTYGCMNHSMTGRCANGQFHCSVHSLFIPSMT